MVIAGNMDVDGDSYLKEEYCFFDGNHKRVRDFVTLTASYITHCYTDKPFLQPCNVKMKMQNSFKFFGKNLTKLILHVFASIC